MEEKIYETYLAGFLAGRTGTPYELQKEPPVDVVYAFTLGVHDGSCRGDSPRQMRTKVQVAEAMKGALA